MPVFDQATKVGRKVKDPGTDKTLPVEKALSYSAMTSTGGLAGATGIDCKLVHGDRWQQIDGNFTEQINVDVQTTINSNETRTIIGNQTLTTIGNVVGSIIGTEVLLNVGAQSHTYVSPRIEIHAGDKNKEDPGDHMEVIETLEKCHVFKAEFMGSTLEVTGAAIGLIGFKTEVVQIEVKAEDIGAGFHGIKCETGGLQNMVSGLYNEASGAAARVRAMDLKAGPDAQAPPCSLGTN